MRRSVTESERRAGASGPMRAFHDMSGGLLVAIGGNATHPRDIKGTAAEQFAVAAATGRALLPLMTLGRELIVTHGNG
ncbi:MAG: hypothetical protein QF738_10665, partial [Rhodospirillales bacterium]|nr:hypothetical protein [Rhodospirillales bacterium]